MKILFLANRIPYPPYRGDKLKIFNLAKRLKGKHELYLLTFTQTLEDMQYKEKLEEYFKEVHLVHLPKLRSVVNCLAGAWDDRPLQVLYFQSAGMREALASLMSKHTFDAVHVQHLRMSPYLSKNKSVPRILDLPDAFSLYWERRKLIKRGLVTRIFESIEQKRVLRYERVLNEYDLCLVCSQEDQEYLKQTHKEANIKLLPNGVDLTTFAAKQHNYDHNHTLLFTGNMDYAPNVDAVIYFTEQILPLIQVAYPGIKFIIAGQRPVKKVMDLESGHVVITGFVKDLAATYNSASVVVAPLRFGAGTQNKVLEAMAMGVPVVCSHIGFKGLGIASGDGAIMQTDPTAFAKSVISLLDSAQMRKDVGSKGMAVVREKFDWDAISRTLDGYFKEITATR